MVSDTISKNYKHYTEHSNEMRGIPLLEEEASQRPVRQTSTLIITLTFTNQRFEFR